MFFTFPDDFKQVELLPGITINLAWGKDIMISYAELGPHFSSPSDHHHPHEQGGYIIEGELDVVVGEHKRYCKAGDVFISPVNMIHGGFTRDKPVRMIEAFSPRRDDYIDPESVRDEGVPKINSSIKAKENGPIFSFPDDFKKKVLMPGAELNLVWGERLMISRATLQPGFTLKPHTHPQEQLGYIVEGETELVVGDEKRVLKGGDAFYAPSNVPHGGCVLNKPTTFIEFFTPPREDYI